MPDTNRIARIVRQRRRRRERRLNQAPRISRWIGCGLVTFLVTVVLVATISTSTSLGVYAYYAQQLPPADSIVSAQQEAFQTTIFYERTGQFPIYEVIDPFGGDRQYAFIDEVPSYFLEATVAIEDASFYENPGFDLRGMTRALYSNLSGGQLQGGSTITQQLVKNALLPVEERTSISVDRKIKEIILASELSRLYSKDQILEWYINTNFYGNLAYGIEAASRVYFDKPAQDLTLAEAALLAAIPQFPLQNPLDNPDAARQRQEIVLNAMVDEGFITQAQAQDALAEPIVINAFAQRFNITAPHFSLFARSEAQAILDDLGYDGARLISQGGLKIYTTLDLDLQQQLECVARSHVDRLASANPTFTHNTSAGTDCIAAQLLREPTADIATEQHIVTNAAGIIMKAQTGEIAAMMGSVDFWNKDIDGNFNGSLAFRQPASTFKPFVYVTAFFNPLDQNTVVTPATMTYDVPTTFSTGQIAPYEPLNIDRQFHGPVSVRTALARSYNVPAVQVLNWVGLSKVLRTAHSMGINTMNDPNNYGLALALGTADASLLDMTYAYNVFNNLGTMVGTPVFPYQAKPGYRQLNPVSILRIEDASGKTLWAYGENEGTFDRRRVLDAGMAYMITDILSDTESRLEAFPRGNVLDLSRPAAVKTGTSDDFRDSWTIGYTPQYTTGIWVGNNDNRPMENITGSVGAAPIWNAMMEYIHLRDQEPVMEWERPGTIVEQNVCLWSGLLPTSNCQQVTDIFYYDPIAGIDYRPNQRDTYWISLQVNTCNNTLATAYSPPQCVTTKTYFQFPEELEEWAKSTPGIDLPPTAYDLSGSDSLFSPVLIASPAFLEKVSGTVEITGNADDESGGTEFQYYYLEVGQGSPPESWQRIGDNQEENGRGILLGEWDTRELPDGLYTLRLSMVRQDNSAEFANREVTVDNTPPTVRLLEPLTTKTYSRERDVFIEVVAEVADNFQINTVDFYIDGELVESLDEAPYTTRWLIGEGASAEVWTVVGDSAGNITESEHRTIQLEP